MTHISLDRLTLLYNSSFAVSITSASARDNRKDKDSTNVNRLGSQTTVDTKLIEIKNRNVTDVIYVAPSNAKTARLELEKVGYFDSRYKLVKVELNENKGTKRVVIGIPITKHCKSLFLSEGKEGLSPSLESVVGWGQEAAPFSSSQMSKMANRAN